MIIPVEAWGADHFSTLVYLETCVVDAGGVIQGEKMRGRDSGYPTQLREGEVEDHGDMDCIEDMRACGLVTGGERNTFRAWNAGEGPNPHKQPLAPFNLTSAGWRLAHLLRRSIAAGVRVPSVEAVLDAIGGTKYGATNQGETP